MDLVGYRVERYLGEVLIDERQYESLEDLTETELEALDFSELVSVTDEELEHYHSKTKEYPALLPLGATVHMEGRAFQVDNVNFDKGSVTLQDVALAEMRMPVFREEPLALVRELYEEQDMIRSGRDSSALTPLSSSMVETLTNLQKISGPDADKYKGIPTGFRLLDTVLTGLGRGDLVILAARPGMGKTSFALNIATRVAMQQKVPVAIFSLEMTKEQLTNRILSSEAGIDSQAFRTGALRAEDWEYLALATEKLHDAPIYMDDTSGITITEMKAKIRRVNQDPARPNVGLIVIDYLQLMTTGQRSENRVQEISSITRNLKIMAKEMNVPIIALSQLSRAVEKQGNNSSHRLPGNDR